jgi:hypothetical protein
MNGSYQVENYFQELQRLQKSLVTISDSSPLQHSRREVLAVYVNNNPCQQTRSNSAESHAVDSLPLPQRCFPLLEHGPCRHSLLCDPTETALFKAAWMSPVVMYDFPCY